MEQEHLGKVLHQISLMNQKQVNQRLKNLDLSMVQGLVLIWLEEVEGYELPIKTLEKMSETAQPTMLGVINRLEQKSFVTTNLNEKRKKMVKITDGGLNMIPHIKKCIEEVEAGYFHDFSVGEHTLFMELLQRAKNNLAQYCAIDEPFKKENKNEQ